jgi:RNA polymerase sigma-70 factor (ECF subfamily)
VRALSLNDEQLMQAYVAGDREAFRELFRRYTPQLLRLFVNGGAHADAQDLLQQTFLQLHRARFDYRSCEPLRPWVFTIARNLRRELTRRRARRPEAELHDASDLRDSSSSSDPTRPLEAERIRAALATLPPPQQEVIELHWLQELPFSEVAQVVGASLSVVKVRAHRGYRALRAILGEEPDSATPDNQNEIPPYSY